MDFLHRRRNIIGRLVWLGTLARGLSGKGNVLPHRHREQAGPFYNVSVHYQQFNYMLEFLSAAIFVVVETGAIVAEGASRAVRKAS